MQNLLFVDKTIMPLGLATTQQETARTAILSQLYSTGDQYVKLLGIGFENQ